MNRLCDKRKKGSKRCNKATNLINKRWKPSVKSEMTAAVHSEHLEMSAENNEPEASTSCISSSPLPSTTASERKLNLAAFEASVNPGMPHTDFSLVHASVWEQLYKGMKCTQCSKPALKVQTSEISGFAFKILVTCESCKTTIKEVSSSPRVHSDDSIRPSFEVNRRMVTSFLNIGSGHADLEKFCIGMGMSCFSSTTYSKHVTYIAKTNADFTKEVLKKAHAAVRQAHIDMDATLRDSDIIDITVSYDGTWMKRGHSSLYGMGFVIDVLTGLVVDFEILSKFCPYCSTNQVKLNEEEFKIWLEEHKLSGTCENNYDGSSNAMEAKAAEILWERSTYFTKFRYTTILSDGDAKTFKHLQNMKVYGDDVPLQKEECINHVSKRLSKGLKAVVEEWKKKGVTLGGKKPGSLTEDIIARLQIYYRIAIMDNIPNVQDMKRGIFATLHHCSSTDSNPQHSNCPTGVTSWCFYNRAIAKEEKIPNHDARTMRTFLRQDVISKIMPVYQRLASDEILKRCTFGKTQNANESLHSVVWRKCPKEVFVSLKRLQIAVSKAVAEFNFGSSSSLKLSSEVKGTSISPASLKITHGRDVRRLQHASASTKKSAKTSRRKLKLKKSVADQRKRRQEGPTYEPGGF